MADQEVVRDYVLTRTDGVGRTLENFLLAVVGGKQTNEAHGFFMRLLFAAEMTPGHW